MAENIIELIEERFSFPVEVRENAEISSIGTTDEIFLKRDGRRIAFVLINLGSNAVYIRPEKAASSTLGIRLAPTGGNISEVWEEDFILPSLQWHIISDGANNAIYSLEILIGGG